jgi:hypothetical protein
MCHFEKINQTCCAYTYCRVEIVSTMETTKGKRWIQCSDMYCPAPLKKEREIERHNSKTHGKKTNYSYIQLHRLVRSPIESFLQNFENLKKYIYFYWVYLWTD